MEATIYNEKGKSAGTINLPESVFGLSLNNDMVHQVVTSLLTNKRKPFAHTKDRGEVAGGGKKPWQQKGTGRARHGSIRSPLWVGGGVTHGPNNKKSFARKVNKAMKTQTLFMILSEKFRNGEIMFVDSISLTKPKTADAKVILSALDGVKGYKGVFSKKNNATLIAFNTKNLSAEKSLRNFNNISFNEVRNLNPVDVLNYKYLVITEPKQAVEFLEKKLVK